MWGRRVRRGGCGSGCDGQWFRRGRGEPASSRRFLDIFMQSDVGKEGGRGKEGSGGEEGGWEVGRVGGRKCGK